MNHARSITEFGAVPDGATINTRAIQSAIDQLAQDGGGTLGIPAGKFLTGSIFLKPGVNLHLDSNAVLLGSTNLEDFPSIPTRIEGATHVWRPAIVNAHNCDNFQITGQGTIQGGGKIFWDEFWRRRKADPAVTNLAVERPRNIFIRDSQNVRVSGISMRESGFWNLHLYRCRNVTIEGVDIRTPPMSPSTDGIDLDSCQDVTVVGCYISVDDDNIAIKGTKGPLADKDKDSPANERIRIVNCTFGHGHGVVTLGSEACLVDGVLVENCKVEDPPDVGNAAVQTCLVKLKVRPDTPQHYQNIHFRNIALNTIGSVISIEPWTQFFNLKGQAEPAQRIENITVENVSGRASEFGRIAGPPKCTIRNVSLRNLDLTLRKTEVPIESVQGLAIQNCLINGKPFSHSDGVR
jgi:polygalacturonase